MPRRVTTRRSSRGRSVNSRLASIERSIKEIETEMIRIDDLERLFTELNEIKQKVGRSGRKRLSLFSNRSRETEDGDNSNSSSGLLSTMNLVSKAPQIISMLQNPAVKSMISKYTGASGATLSKLDPAKITSLLQNPMVLKMAKNFLG